MIMVYALGAVFWVLSWVIGIGLLFSGRTRKAAAFMILVPTLSYWTALFAAGAVLVSWPTIEAISGERMELVFPIVFLGAQALAALIGLSVGIFLASRLTRSRSGRLSS